MVFTELVHLVLDIIVAITIDRSRYTKNTVSVDYKMYMHEKKINTVGVTSRTGYCLPFRSTYVHPRFLVGFVLLDL
jgi:hypothetical protein